MRNRIPVAIAFTPNYIVPASVTISTILSSSDKETVFLIFCLLSEDLPRWQIEALSSLVGNRAELRFVNLVGRLGDIYVNPRYTEAASYRLLLPRLLPGIDKVIYIDCDIVVRNDLTKVFHGTDLEEYYLAGVFEATLDHQVSHMKQIGCSPGAYINSGFLIMNLELMRQDGVTEKLLDALNTEYLEFPDQDVLNMICKGRILGLPPVYNSIRTFFLPQYKDQFLRYYSEIDWQNVQRRGSIHYTGGKPWNVFSVMFMEWWNEYENLPSSIKVQMPINRRLYVFFLIYRTSIGSFLVDGLRGMYRKIRYRT